MRRNDDLIRQLMLVLENANTYVSDLHQVPGYKRDEVAYHLAQIVKSGFAEGPAPRYPSTGEDPTIPSAVIVKRLTPAGHDFISELRDDTVWAKVKERTAKVGGSVELRDPQTTGQCGHEADASAPIIELRRIQATGIHQHPEMPGGLT